MAGWKHTSPCGCLKSPPKPDGRTLAGREWRKAWTTELAEHHVQCCQQRTQQGWLNVCLAGDQTNCPHVGRDVEYERAAGDQGWRYLR